MEAATSLRVVSVPASNRAAARMRSSSALSRSPSCSARMRPSSRSSVRVWRRAFRCVQAQSRAPAVGALYRGRLPLSSPVVRAAVALPR